MKKQLKTLGMGLIIGATMITAVGCGGADDTADKIIRAEKVESMIVGTVKGLGEITDYSEDYIQNYKDTMNKHDYVEMKIHDMNAEIREELKREVEQDEVDDDILNSVLREEIEKDMVLVQEQITEEVVEDYDYEEEDEIIAVEAKNDMTGREVEETMNGYIYNNYPGYKGGNLYFENNKVYKNILDDSGVSIATIEMDYLGTGIITVCE